MLINESIMRYTFFSKAALLDGQKNSRPNSFGRHLLRFNFFGTRVKNDKKRQKNDDLRSSRGD